MFEPRRGYSASSHASAPHKFLTRSSPLPLLANQVYTRFPTASIPAGRGTSGVYPRACFRNYRTVHELGNYVPAGFCRILPVFDEFGHRFDTISTKLAYHRLLQIGATVLDTFLSTTVGSIRPPSVLEECPVIHLSITCLWDRPCVRLIADVTC